MALPSCGGQPPQTQQRPPQLTPSSVDLILTGRHAPHAPEPGGEVVIDSLEEVVDEARGIIHDNDVDRLRQLLTETPALLSWRGHGYD